MPGRKQSVDMRFGARRTGAALRPVRIASVVPAAWSGLSGAAQNVFEPGTFEAGLAAAASGPLFVAGHNNAATRPQGNRNHASITRKRAGNDGAANRAAFFAQSLNKTPILRQRMQNEAFLEQAGAFNAAAIAQIGHRNRATTSQTGTDQLTQTNQGRDARNALIAQPAILVTHSQAITAMAIKPGCSSRAPPIGQPSRNMERTTTRRLRRPETADDPLSYKSATTTKVLSCMGTI